MFLIDRVSSCFPARIDNSRAHLSRMIFALKRPKAWRARPLTPTKYFPQSPILPDLSPFSYPTVHRPSPIAHPSFSTSVFVRPHLFRSQLQTTSNRCPYLSVPWVSALIGPLIEEAHNQQLPLQTCPPQRTSALPRRLLMPSMRRS